MRIASLHRQLTSADRTQMNHKSYKQLAETLMANWRPAALCLSAFVRPIANIRRDNGQVIQEVGYRRRATQS